jgi:hypothetical protein
MSSPGPRNVTDQLSRSALTVLFTVVVIHVSWQLIQPLLGPLILIIAVLGVVRLAVGFRGRSGW